MKTNNLKHKIECKDSDGNNMYISIRLNDECKNGHQDFAITADIYEKGKPKIDKYCFMAGCCHDEIIAARPELKIFVDLHLCDCEGIPMYAVENGFYHLQNGFNNIKTDHEDFKKEFCDYYRITENQYNKICKSQNKLQYALHLQNLGILRQWKKQADKAIKLLEGLTGDEFINDSIKTQYHAPKEEEIKEEEEKQKNGYYSDKAIQEREEEKKQIIFNKIEEEREEKIKSINLEYDTKQAVLLVGGEKAYKNCIFYNHTKKLCFNWVSWDMITKNEYDNLLNSIKLPEGVTIEKKEGSN